MQEEIWKNIEIEGLKFSYQVSNTAKVRMLDRPAGKSALLKKRKLIILGKVLKQRLKVGYYASNFCFNNKHKETLIHRLVATAFIPNPENLPQVNHINGIKTDNRIENLEWCTPQYNRIHALETGLAPTGEGLSMSKFNEAQIVEIFRMNAEGLPGKQIAERFGVYKNAIYHILNKKNWRRFSDKIGLVKEKPLVRLTKKNNKKSTPVIQMDLVGNVVNEFPSMGEVSRVFKCNTNAVWCAINKNKPLHGFLWKKKLVV